MAPTKAAVVALLSLVALRVTPCQGFAAAQWPSLRVQAPAAPQARPSPSPGGLRQSRMSVVDAVKSFPWVLIPGGVAAGILVREGGLGAIGVFFEDTLDYLEDKGGYVITEEQLKGGAGQEPPVGRKTVLQGEADKSSQGPRSGSRVSIETASFFRSWTKEFYNAFRFGA